MKTAKKSLLLILCAIALVAASVMGTIAYLSDSDSVTNTFAGAKLMDGDFLLQEHVATRTGANNTYTLSTDPTDANDYQVVPGVNLPKDPWVEFKLAEQAYLFLEVEDTLTYEAKVTGTEGAVTVDPAQSVTWELETIWKPLMKDGQQVKHGENPIYYCVADNESGIMNVGEHNHGIIAEDTVKVGNNFDTDNLAAKAHLSFVGYLFQSSGFTDVNAAWDAAVVQFKLA